MCLDHWNRINLLKQDINLICHYGEDVYFILEEKVGKTNDTKTKLKNLQDKSTLVIICLHCL